jgi:hypothetical protein
MSAARHKLTPARRRVLHLLERDGPQPYAPFAKDADACVAAGWAEWCDLIRRGMSLPAGVKITAAGRTALGEDRSAP